MTTTETVKFDPGWGCHVLVYSGSVEYLYKDINKFKNKSQKSFKFKQYFPKIIQILENNVGFYTGCLLWAIYLKSFPNSEITGNHCLGQTYDEKCPDIEPEYILKSLDNLKKDHLYYTGKEYSFPASYKTIMEKYLEFATLNKGFTQTKTTEDLKLPTGLKEATKELLEEIRVAAQEAADTGNITELISFADKIL
jgi:hypothetical protein